MAYATSAPARLMGRRDGVTPQLWSYVSADDPEAVAATGYFTDGQSKGMRVGDIVVIQDTDNARAPVMSVVSAISSGAATVQLSASGSSLATEAGTGITAGTGTVYQSAVSRQGGIITTKILIDLTGLNSMNTDGDIIGVNDTANPCHLGQITAEECGTILGGIMRCLEVPAGGDPNIALYSATEATGVENGAIGSLTETLLFDPNADWTIDMSRSLTAFPAADEYLYLVQGDATGTDATYTGGKFLIELIGYAS